jgi:hypothetical protein
MRGGLRDEEGMGNTLAYKVDRDTGDTEIRPAEVSTWE